MRSPFLALAFVALTFIRSTSAVAQPTLPGSMTGHWCADGGTVMTVELKGIAIGVEGEPLSCEIRSISRQDRNEIEFRAFCNFENIDPHDGDFRLAINRSRLTIDSFAAGRKPWSGSYQRCGDPNSAKPDTTYYEMKLQTDYFGGDLAEYRKMQQFQCEMFCSADARCIGYSYVESREWCSLKSALNRQRFSSRVVSGIKRQRASRPPIETAMQSRAGVDLPGGDYHNYRDVSLIGCRTLCEKDGRCAGFSYVTAVGSCWLKSSITVSREKAGVVSATRGPFP